MLWDNGGRIIHANSATRDMAQDASFFTVSNDRLRLDDPNCAAALHSGIVDMKEGTPASEKGDRRDSAWNGSSISALIGTLEIPASSVPDDPQFALYLSPPAQTQ